MAFLNRDQRKEVRRLLRSLLKNGRLQARRTYYDYYDSCHAPEETPNAQWTKAEDLIKEDRLMSGGDSISLKGPGIWELSNGYSRYELRIKGEKNE